MQSQNAHHFNGTATTTPAKVELGRLMQHLNIRNLDTTDGLEVSFNGGQSFYTIPAGQFLSESVRKHEFWVRATAGTVDYCAIVLG